MTGKCVPVQEVLLDFTVHYLVSQPTDLVDFALEYFRSVNLCKTTLDHSWMLCLKPVATEISTTVDVALKYFQVYIFSPGTVQCHYPKHRIIWHVHRM